MSGSFVFDDNSLKKKLKKALPFIGIVGLILAVLAILILPSRGASMEKCDDLGLGSDFVTVLSGNCAKNFNEIVFVVGDTQNSPAPALNYPDYIDTALNINKASISAISVSNSHRNPKLVADHEEFKNAKKLKEETIKYLSSMTAVKDGANYLEAIQTAADSTEDKDKTLIYVIGSGLSDQGLLDFANEGLLQEDIEPEEIAEKVADYIDDNKALKGVTIIWDGIGQTVSPQTALDNESSEKLETIYADVFQSLGASKSNIRFKNKLNNESSVKTDYVVKPTPTGEAKIDFSRSYTSDTTTALQFNGDAATFLDMAATDSAATEIANNAKAHPSARVTATAYMSRGSCPRDVPDSNLLGLRLDAIRDVLVSKGVDASRIELIAGGFGDAPECDANNNYNPDEGAKNRRVDVTIKN